MKYFYCIMLLLSVTSCAVHSGLTSNYNSHNTTVELSKANFKVISYVIGSSSAQYFITFGGLNKDALIESARKNMLEKANLIGKSRAVINETVEIKRKTILLFTEIKVTVSAHVIEFNDEDQSTLDIKEKNLISTEELSEVTPENSSITILRNLNNQLIEKKIKTALYDLERMPKVGDYVIFKSLQKEDQIGQIQKINCNNKMCPCELIIIDADGELGVSLVRFVDLISYVIL
jgi:hypothetical protein